MAQTSLFVYGTLMHGEPRHDLLHGAHALGPAYTASGYALYHLGGYPALSTGEGAVAGELYAVEPAMLEAMDAYEGVPELYQREPIRLADGRLVEAYIMRPEQVRAHPVIPSGHWRDAL